MTYSWDIFWVLRQIRQAKRCGFCVLQYMDFPTNRLVGKMFYCSDFVALLIITMHGTIKQVSCLRVLNCRNLCYRFVRMAGCVIQNTIEDNAYYRLHPFSFREKTVWLNTHKADPACQCHIDFRRGVLVKRSARKIIFSFLSKIEYMC